MPLELTFYGNSVTHWVVAGAIALGSFIALMVIRRVLVSRFERFATRSERQWDDAILDVLRRTRAITLLVLGILAGAQVLTLPDRTNTILETVTGMVFLFQAGLWASSLARGMLDRFRERRMTADRGAATMIAAAGFIIQCFIWSAVVLIALDNVGVDITALVAGLGVGGVAIALAVQNILGDLFGSLAIVLDKPFVLGDFIIVGDLLGTVEHIGLKTTRIRSLWGEQLIFSNADLLSSRIRNYGRMQERRVVFDLRVSFETPRDDLRKIPGIIKEAITAQEGTRFDRSHFAAYDQHAYKYESVYYVLSPDYNRYMDIQQAIYFHIHERFEELGIKVPYPTTTVYLPDRERLEPAVAGSREEA